MKRWLTTSLTEVETIKPRTLVLTARARRDLVEIHDYIAKDNPIAAAAFTRRLTAHIERIAELGLTGSPRDWLRVGLRASPFEKRCFYFEVTDTELIVLRVLHGAQDVDTVSFWERKQ